MLQVKSSQYLLILSGLAGNWECKNIDMLSLTSLEDLGYDHNVTFDDE